MTITVKAVPTPAQLEGSDPTFVGRRHILATAGSGKTWTIIEAIRRLLQEGVPGTSILACSFAKSSIAAFHEKLLAIGCADKGVRLATLHNFMYELLIHCHSMIGYSSVPKILSESESRNLLKQCIMVAAGIQKMEELRGYSEKDVKAWLGEYQVRLYSTEPKDYNPYFSINPPKIGMQKAVELYLEKLKSYNIIDFDSILTDGLRILIQARGTLTLPRYMFIDEAQDLSAIQWAIISELTTYTSCTTIIGDDDQSIYLWRNALPWRFINAAHQSDKRINLTTNRRCASSIVKLAADVVSAIPNS
ncbi:MAG: hypothetical protein EOO88_50280, partial [Pedobacter sp.]